MLDTGTVLRSRVKPANERIFSGTELPCICENQGPVDLRSLSA